jgi:hypothetical protein
MATSIESDSTTGPGWTPETLGPLFNATERKHQRPSLLKFGKLGLRPVGSASEIPDWRFHRHVIRLGLYLRERAHVQVGDRIALVATLGPEWAVAQWASLTQGLTTACIDSRRPSATIAEQLSALGPRVVFADGAALQHVLAWNAAGDRGATVIAIEGDATAPAVSWSEALDLGGTLDTAERANAYRAAMRSLPSETPALGHVARNGVGTVWRFLSHREVVRRVQRVWQGARISSGDVAYLEGGAPSLGSILAFLAFSADGHTQVVLGTPGREVEEIEAEQPTKIVVGADVARKLPSAIAGLEASPLRGRAGRWLARARALASRVRPGATRDLVDRSQRARWLGTGESLDESTRARLGRSMTLDLDPLELEAEAH